MLLPTRWRKGDARVSKVRVLLGGAGRAGASGMRGRMRAGFRPRPSPAGGHEEDRGQGPAGSTNGQEEGPGQKARAQEEGRGTAKAGGRPPQGGTGPPEEDKRPRAKGTAAADKPAEEGAKQTEEESRGPRAAGPEIGEVGRLLLRECARGERMSRNLDTLPHRPLRASWGG